MPSRAVLRKKARREAKRQKLRGDTTAATMTTTAATATRAGHNDAAVTPVVAATATRARALTTPSPAAAVASPRVSRKRPRSSSSSDKDAAATAGGDDGLTHRERVKLASRRRLERQIARLTTQQQQQQQHAQVHSDATMTTADDVDDDATSASARAAAATAAAAAVRERHDPRFANGTFWRTRKEQRARTLFLGGLPASYTTAAIKDFIASVLDADEHAAEHVRRLASSSSSNNDHKDGSDDHTTTTTPADVVEHVDVLTGRRRTGVQHMYVRMASVGLAGCVAAALDGYAMPDGRRLRCNFAADKTQRAEAIRRRQGMRQ